MSQKSKHYFKEDEFRKQLRIINSPRYNEYHKKK
jgi:gluconate kinase